MPYYCSRPEAYAGQVVDNGQCVRFVQVCAHAPETAKWKKGVPVRGAQLRAGTVIATFVNGKYPNWDHGNHAAVYVGQDDKGIWVWEQWQGKHGTVHKRHIPFLDPPTEDRSNNGNAFSVVE